MPYSLDLKKNNIFLENGVIITELAHIFGRIIASIYIVILI
ncbi:MAG: hypothetical protein O4805_05525 [Trichodesmium sp. St16_bin2-tuft]|nr:hypothetical protein [Trichodesmium sp. St18_bin1]MDE5086630.1 hypothetical protein [Trichodesmium sp. St16_bin2-tuft]